MSHTQDSCLYRILIELREKKLYIIIYLIKIFIIISSKITSLICNCLRHRILKSLHKLLIADACLVVYVPRSLLCTCIIQLLLNVLYIWRHSSIHLWEKKAQDSLTILPIKVVKVNFICIRSLILLITCGSTSGHLLSLLAGLLLLLLALVETSGISSLLLQVDRLCRMRLAIKSSSFALSWDLLSNLFLDLLKSFQEELLDITSLIQNNLTQSFDLTKLRILGSHDFS